MRKIFIYIHLSLLFCFSVSAQDFRKVADGVEHAVIVRQMKAADGKLENAVMNLLRLDLTKVRLDVVHAMDSAIGLEKTSSIAARHGAMAAINAGFFRIDRSIFEGDNVAVLQIDGKLLSENTNDRIAMGIFNGAEKSEVGFARFKFVGNLKVENRLRVGMIRGINRQRNEQDDLIVFTPEFHRTTLTSPNGLEIIVRKNKVVEIIDGKGSSLIPTDGFVLSATGTAREELRKLKRGEKVELNLGVISADEDKTTRTTRVVEDIVGGVPRLVKNGVIDITWQEEKSSKAFVETKHPRTAVAKLKDGKFLMVTVDGRSEESAGINLNDLAAFLLEMGATDAMNLDGGGSTTMFLEGKVVNKPSDKEGERRVGDAILVTPRRR